MSLYNVAEPIVEFSERFRGHQGLVRTVHPVEWEIPVHGCHQRECARRSHYIITCRQHIQIGRCTPLQQVDPDFRTESLKSFNTHLRIIG